MVLKGDVHHLNPFFGGELTSPKQNWCKVMLDVVYFNHIAFTK